MRQRSHQPSAATVGEGGGSKARAIQGSARHLQLCKELFFAGFPCAQPYALTNPDTAADGKGPALASSSSSSPPSAGVRPLSKPFIRGFFQQYGPVEALFYDEARGMGSVVFVDGADAESCYLAVHLSFLPATTSDGGVGAPTWEQDLLGEDLAERRARPRDLLLCLEFAHCCPFVNPVLLTRDVFVEGGAAHCEVPGGELSRAILFHRFPHLLLPPPPPAPATAAAEGGGGGGSTAPRAMVPVAPHVVMRWREVEEEGEEEEAAENREGGDHGEGTPATNTTSEGWAVGGGRRAGGAKAKPASRVEVLNDDEDEENKKKNKEKDGTRAHEERADEDKAKTRAATRRRLAPVGPTFPGRSVEPVEVERALWQLLRPSHLTPSATATVTVLDLWWVYYNLYMVHKTQPAAGRIADPRYRFAQRPSLYQELREVQRQGREYGHGDDAAAQQVLLRLVHDHQFHNVLSYLTVKEKFKYDPTWASLMRDLYKPKLVLQVEAWQALMEEKEKAGKEEGGGASDSAATAAAAAAAAKVVDTEVRRRRVVMKAIEELHEPTPTRARDVEWVRRAEQTWLTLPRPTAAANVMENVKFLAKVRRGEVDRSGKDKDMSQRPPLPLPPGGAQSAGGATRAEGEGEKMAAGNEADMAAAYPSMSTRQKDEQFYAEVLQNIDGYVAIGTADELVAMCEDPKLFRYAKHHIGYEEAHRQPSYWLAYLNALWVPLIAFLLLGFGSYYIVDRLGISKVNELKLKEERQREFHDELRRLLEQQQRALDAAQQDNTTAGRRAALQAMDATMKKASEAAKKAGGKFNFELRGDL